MGTASRGIGIFAMRGVYPPLVFYPLPLFARPSTPRSIVLSTGLLPRDHLSPRWLSRFQVRLLHSRESSMCRLSYIDPYQQPFSSPLHMQFTRHDDADSPWNVLPPSDPERRLGVYAQRVFRKNPMYIILCLLLFPSVEENFCCVTLS